MLQGLEDGMKASLLGAFAISLSVILGCDAFHKEEALPQTAPLDQLGAEAQEKPQAATAAAKQTGDRNVESGAIVRPHGWTAKSHSSKASASPHIVFPQDQVIRIELQFDPADWQALLDDMTEIYGEFGSGQMGGPEMELPQEAADACKALAEGEKCSYTKDGVESKGTCSTMGDGGVLTCFSHEGHHDQMMQKLCTGKGEGESCGGKMGPMDLAGVCLMDKHVTCVPNQALSACQNLGKGDACLLPTPMGDLEGVCDTRGARVACIVKMGPPGSQKKGGKMPGPGAPGGPPIEFGRNPIWIPCLVTFQGNTWTHVGFRFKGNSTLAMSWGQGRLKMPFKLDFDQFEQQFPEVKDQRFFGYKKLSFANNMRDSSCLREKVAGDLFRAAGLPSAHRVFVLVTMDFGQGPENLGLFTMAESPDKPLLREYFGKANGNLYKPRGEAATFGAGLTIDETCFPKESNKTSDWSDIKALVAALHASRIDAARWRSDLEARFDVDSFLNWLAVNTILQDWDTYGTATHNFYLYSNPAENGKIHWIPWDHNESMKSSDGMNMVLPLDMSTVTDQWPLIRFLMDEPAYAAIYWRHVREFTDGPFASDTVKAHMQALHDLIAPYLEDPDLVSPHDALAVDASAFAASLDSLFQHVDKRLEAAKEAMAVHNGESHEQGKGQRSPQQ